jgi:hypothetical protein
MRKLGHSVWIIEAKGWDGIPGWRPTAGIGLCRADGRLVLADWKKRNPDDHFRLRRYRGGSP